MPARLDRLPLTYDECRARFRQAAAEAGLPVQAHHVDERGPQGQQLSIDCVQLGVPHAARGLVVLSGVHGVEGFVGSTLQTDLLQRWTAIPSDVRVLIVHAVNPWGMAWWRRQNESNVDLNRNWQRDRGVPFQNEAYDELHELACPDTDDLPDEATMLDAAAALVAERGLAWVRDGITAGQYRHPDGLHYGGERTEQSNRILEALVSDALAGADRVLTVDLHTGHGRRGELTALSDQPPGSPQDRFLRSWCDRVEATAENPEAATGPKAGQIARGLQTLLDADCFAATLEVGTADDLEQLGATYQEQWVHRRGNREDPDHRAAIWRYRCCFTPDDPAWEQDALRHGRAHLDGALDALAGWS